MAIEDVVESAMNAKEGSGDEGENSKMEDSVSSRES